MNPKIRNGIIIAVLLILSLAICGRIVWTKIHENKLLKIASQLRENNWPAEKKLTAEKVKARQAVDKTHGAVTIDLKPYINAKLTEAPMCWKGNNANSLAELPAGKNIYAGVPFDVEGSIQLMGGYLQHYGKKYPTEVDSIPIHRQCAKIHLLHAAGEVRAEHLGVTIDLAKIDMAKLADILSGKAGPLDAYMAALKTGTNATLAKLVIHYEDGSTREIDMVAGRQVFGWWWPTFMTGVPEFIRMPAPDTELAWVGSNPWLRQWLPDLSLCLFRTSFENPQPGVAISTVDYVSTVTIACPFLVALTVE